MVKKNKQKLLIGLVLLSILVITVGATYAFFSYTKQGTKDNVIETGTITFLYTEIDKVGAGIEIEDAIPMSDGLGKVQTGDNKVFNFKIQADTTSTTAINYEITAKKSDDSTLDEKVVKLYLTKVNNTTEEEVLLNTFDKLDLPTKEGLDTTKEKLLYKGKVPSDMPNYEQSFRLRMWIDEKTDFSGIEQEDGTIVYPYNDKSFKINVNVYADGNVVTEENTDLESSVEYTSILAGGEELTKVEDETLDYQYEIDLQNVDSTTITVNTKSENATVEIEKLDSLMYSSNIKRLSISKVLDLTVGENYFKVTITSEDKKNIDSFIIKINLEKTDKTIEAESILDALSNNNLTSGYYSIKANGEEYPVHLYVLEGDQTFSTNKTFGDADDIGTSTEYAKNMVVVKVKGNLTINNGVTVEPYYTEYGGPKGFTLYIDGTLTNNGTIDNSHGAKAEGQNVYLYKNNNGTYETVPATGAAGGASIKNLEYGAAGNNGQEGKNRATGGGASGGSGGTNPLASGSGSSGTSYSGGSGGGGIYCVSGTCNQPGNNASTNGGAGGTGVVSADGYTVYASGGAGNNAGKSAYSTGRTDGNTQNTQAESGTGGLLIIYADTISNNGNITANGSNVNGKKYSDENRHAGGGASGAGSINIFFNNIRKTGSITATGGISSLDTSGINYSAIGGSGGNGSISLYSISDNNEIKYIYNFDYIDDTNETKEQTFKVSISGNYKLETWGAQGGNITDTITGGYGAYSTGNVYLTKGEMIYINVGGTGKVSLANNQISDGGYNGGGFSASCMGTATDVRYSSGGGGATHISKKSGLLSELEQYKGELNINQNTYDSNTILIVSGGGAGMWYYPKNSSKYYIKTVGHAGGYVGNTGISYLSGSTYKASGGTQLNSGTNNLYYGTFGSGVTSNQVPSLTGNFGTAGAGGGYYGGSINNAAAGGGSSYIGSLLLTDKAMYCYDCEESDEEATKTISTTGTSTERDTKNCPNGYSTNPVSKCAKAGNGYARITYIGE